MAFFGLSYITLWDFTTLLISILAIRASWKLYANLFFSPLKHVPGPFWAKATRFWYLRKAWGGNFEKVNLALHQKYGPLVRIAPNQVSVDDVDALKTIYAGAGFTKASWYDAGTTPDTWHGNLVTDRDAQRYAANRKTVNGLYSMTTCTHMEPQFHSCVDLLSAKLREFSESGQAFNLQKWFQYFTLDSIAMVTLNETFGILADGHDRSGVAEALTSFLVYLVHVGIYYEIHPLLIRALSLLPSRALGYMLELTKRLVDSRRDQIESGSNTKGAQDFLDQTLRIHYEKPGNLPLEGVYDICMNNIAAGFDTTSITLTAIINYVFRSPDILTQVSQGTRPSISLEQTLTSLELTTEIEEAKSMGKLSEPLTFAQVQQLPYLQACIKEALRIFPPVSWILPRAVPEGGRTIAKTYLPQGTIVGINAWVAHHNPTVFGDDTDTFRPERWLGGPREDLSLMNKYYLPFGWGARTCIGKNIALMEISIAITRLIQLFDFEEVEPDKPVNTETYWLIRQKDLMYRVSVKQ